MNNKMNNYLDFMAPRLQVCHDLLKDTGSIYLHCDPTSSHYLKVLMDGIFGIKNFRNEIVWCYTSGGVGKRWFGRKHDILLFYSKSKSYHFNIQYRPYSEGTKQRGLTQCKKRLNKKYSLKKEGAIENDWWIGMQPILSPTSKERVKYPTQKPLKLLERIIKASSNPGDTILDPFCGSGTTLVAASQLGRTPIGIDNSKQACRVTRKRGRDLKLNPPISVYHGDCLDLMLQMVIKVDLIYLDPPFGTGKEFTGKSGSFSDKW